MVGREVGIVCWDWIKSFNVEHKISGVENVQEKGTVNFILVAEASQMEKQEMEMKWKLEKEIKTKKPNTGAVISSQTHE